MCQLLDSSWELPSYYWTWLFLKERLLIIPKGMTQLWLFIEAVVPKTFLRAPRNDSINAGSKPRRPTISVWMNFLVLERFWSLPILSPQRCRVGGNAQGAQFHHFQYSRVGSLCLPQNHGQTWCLVSIGLHVWHQQPIPSIIFSASKPFPGSELLRTSANYFCRTC